MHDDQTVNFQRRGWWTRRLGYWTLLCGLSGVFHTLCSARHQTDQKGVALRIYEWTEMRNIVKTINNDYPALGTALPCYRQDDHNLQLSAFQCLECYMFGADDRPKLTMRF